MEGEELWTTSFTEFRPHTIKSCSRVEMMNKCRMLKRRGIFLEEGKTLQKSQVTINVLFKDKNKSTGPYPQTRDRNIEEHLERVKSSVHPDRRQVSSNKNQINEEEVHVAQKQPAEQEEEKYMKRSRPPEDGHPNSDEDGDDDSKY